MEEKNLKDLTREEIGRLFPIEISTYSNNWPALFNTEKELLVKTLDPTLFSRIEHFGSTSIPGLSAKNTIDILMGVEFEETTTQRLIEQMKPLGYDFNWQTEGEHTHMIFVKGYNIYSPIDQTYHIHAGPKGHIIWDRLIFRDYLIAHPQVAKAYQNLKLKLADKYRYERVAYRIAKTDFVKEITERAKQQLG